MRTFTSLRQRLLTTSLFLLAAAVSLNAQAIRGKVTGEDKLPILGALVHKMGSQVHTHSDEQGRYVIEGVAVGDTLQVSLIGHKTTRLVVSDLNRMYNATLEAAPIDLGSVTVRRSSKEVNVISKIDLEVTPVRSAQEILRKVPGLFIGQHAGGGKAEQIFLRGFDIDHGTDVALAVDGIPVNMVSHAHGQGYADMHFLIPETISSIDFGKGPYYAEQGNFATAGYVGFKTKDRVGSSMIGVDAGQFNSLRTVGVFNILDTTNQQAYIAAEYVLSDGPFESPQNFSRRNIMGKYTSFLDNGTRLSLMASHFTSVWDASGQIPQREVDNGNITRFGAIDDTEGGNTSRTNIALSLTKPLNDGAYLKSNIFWSQYDFELFSNFTFFLEDPVNGDQIRQVEDRELFGGQSSYNRKVFVGSGSADLEIGGGFRADQVDDVSLSRTRNRSTLLENIQIGDIQERNYFAFVSADFEFGDFSIQPSLRYDHFDFTYESELAADSLYNPQSQDKGAFSPKLNFAYDLGLNTQLFLKTGIGFHSNDTRVVLSEDRDILPAAYGADLGINFKPARRLIANAALWYLFLEQEFVYVGDAGIVEPSGQTRRMGVDLGFRYQLNDWLFANADGTYTYARSVEDPEGENLIPLAPKYTATGGITARRNNWRSSLQFRYLGDRAANEDNSIVAPGYTVVDLNASRDFGNLTLGFIIENLLDVEWNETQFATESRLRNEPQSVEEIHFTPGTPFFAKATVRYRF